jgi:hypothetical protein
MGTLLRIALFLAIAIPLAHAQTAQVSFAATSAHVAQPGSPVSIKLQRWSTEEERAPIVAALNTPLPPPPPPPAAAPAPAPAADAPEAAAADQGAARAGRAGRAGRGGRGGRGEAPPPPVITPIGALTSAITKAPTIGYIWTDEVTGYSIKYAYRLPQPDGGERIILATSRMLGQGSIQWKPASTDAPTNYEFTVIELRLNAKGLGEGRTSLTTKVVVDKDAKTIALENYSAAPVILQSVKRS